MKQKLIFFSLIFSIAFGTGAYAGSNMPKNLRIGLYYQKTAQDYVEINSEANNGLDIGVSENGMYTSLIKDYSLNKVVVKKDNYTFEKGTENPSAYHVQVGGTYEKYVDAVAVMNALNAKGFNAYPACESGLKVWVGVNGSNYAANKNIEKMKAVFPNYQYSVVEPSAKRIRITNSEDITQIIVSSDLSSSLQIYPIPNNSGFNVIDVNKKGYRGAFEIIRQQDSDMTVINVIPFEQYLYSVTSSEMPSSWNIEALKAQAVAARTYALTHIGSCKSLGFDMNFTVQFQSYTGYSGEDANSRRAVDETSGKIAYYKDKPISAFFFASDGGYTENSENVWTSAVPYLKAVEDKYQPASFNKKNWTTSVTPQEVKDYLSSKGINIGDIIDIKVTSYSKSQNALALKIVGTKGEKVYEKDNIRAFMDRELLYSQTFTVTRKGDSAVSAISKNNAKVSVSLNDVKAVTKDGVAKISINKPLYLRKRSGVSNINIKTAPESFEFNGRGWGHEVGMSQWGAKGMGDAGFTYDQILKYYYTGIEVK